LAKEILGMQGDKVLRWIFKAFEEALGGSFFFLVKILGDHCGGFGG
jgi:hypothetical protein